MKYNNCYNGSYNDYNHFNNIFRQSGNPIINREASLLKKYSLIAGFGVISYLVLSNLAAIILQTFNLTDLYNNNTTFQLVYGIIISVISIFLPFALLTVKLEKSDRDRVFEIELPASGKLYFYAVFAGLMLCCVGDIVTTGFSEFAGVYGINFTSASNPEINSASEYVLFVIECAIVPAIVEEFAFRGVVLQSLRRFGDIFAIVMSAAVFAIMHGNMVQIPFAFIAGLAFGYFVIRTKSLWTSITIHFLNNFYSVIINVYYTKNPKASILPYYILTALIIFFGVYCAYKFIKATKSDRESQLNSEINVTPQSVKKWPLAAAISILLLVSFVYAGCGSYLKTGTPFIFAVFLLIITAYPYFSKRKPKVTVMGMSSTALSPIMKTALFLTTPTLVISIISLLYFTYSTINITSASGKHAIALVTLIIFAIMLALTYKAQSCKGLEEKKAYNATFVILGIVCFIFCILVLTSSLSSLFTTFFSGNSSKSGGSGLWIR